jgi:hypothetical protein
VSPDLRQLAVCWGEQVPGGLLHATFLSTESIATSAPQLMLLGAAAGQLRELCGVLDAALAGVRQEWAGARRELAAADSKLVRNAVRHGVA